IDPLALVTTDLGAGCPAPVLALEDGALAAAPASRAHRGPSIFDGRPQPPPAEPAANAMEDTVLRVPRQAAAGPADTRLSPASAATSWTSRKPCTMRRTVSAGLDVGNPSKRRSDVVGDTP